MTYPFYSEEQLIRAWDSYHQDTVLAPLFLDLDGTIWRGDLAYSALEIAASEGLLTKYLPSQETVLQTQALAQTFDIGLEYAGAEDYGYLTQRVVTKFEEIKTTLTHSEHTLFNHAICQLCADVFENFPNVIIREIGLTALHKSPGLLSNLNQITKNLRAILLRHRSTEILITASYHELVVIAAESLEINPKNIFGLQLSNSIVYPQPIGIGKGAVVNYWCQQNQHLHEPFLAIGDNPDFTDLGLVTACKHFYRM
jgi:hypothetical protein